MALGALVVVVAALPLVSTGHGLLLLVLSVDTTILVALVLVARADDFQVPAAADAAIAASLTPEEQER